MEGHDSLMSHP